MRSSPRGNDAARSPEPRGWRSPHHQPELLQRGAGIRFNGAEKTNVEEYCVSEGWIRVAVGKTLDRKGNPLTIKLKGKVEPFLKDPPAAEG